MTINFELSKYLDKLNHKSKQDVAVVVKSKGTINNVDYYIESMKKHYMPELDENGVYVVSVIKDGIEIHL